MKKHFWKILFTYLKRLRKTAIVILLFIAIFAVVFSLYSLNVEAVLYGAVLSAAVMFVVLAYDFYRYYQKHKLLADLCGSVTVGLDGLPDPADLLEEDYQELIRALYRNKALLVSGWDAKYSDMIDYYTLWTHQIKTPIAAMRVLLQSDEAGRNVKLEQELFKIERYVEMALQYLRIESMSSDLLLREYSLRNVVKQAAKKYATVFIHKKIKLELEDIHCTVLTDEKWLLFVVEQVLSNALKYTKDGGTISIYMEENAEKTLVIEDNGIGIGKGDLPRIFEKGFTGYNGRMDKKSTGIGLYLCRAIMGKLSHPIDIQSEPGVGTKVKLGLASKKIFVE